MQSVPSVPLAPAPAGSAVARAHLWTLAASAALVAGAWWLRTPSVRYLVASIAATGLALAAFTRLRPGARRWGAATIGALGMWCAVAGVGQRNLDRIEGSWPAYRSALLDRASQRFERSLTETAAALRHTALGALDAPTPPPRAFRALASSVRAHPERGVIVYRTGRPAAWGGRIVTPTDSLTDTLGAAASPFYVTLYAVATRGATRAVATAVVDADPPGDRLTPAVGNEIAEAAGLRFDVFTGAAPDPSGPATGGSEAARWFTYPHAGGDTLLAVRVVAPGQDEARLLALERVRLVGATVLAIALLLFLPAAWRHERSLAWRLLPLAVFLGAVALVPLSALSALSAVFDPTVYYAQLGGPFTANAGALGLAAALVLLAILMVSRGRWRVRTPRTAFAVVIVIIVGGPFLLRALSRGVLPPPGGVSAELWLAWQIALFLAATSLLVAAAAAGSVIVGRGRGVPPAVAPVLAAGAAFVGPLVLDASGTWPPWYTIFWILAIGALALTRPHRYLVLAAATVAALGATTLTWSAGVRGRIALAHRDVAGLDTVQPDVVAVLQRLGDAIASDDPPRTQADLARMYVQSDLAGSGYPVALRSWYPRGAPGAQLTLDPISVPPADLERAVTEARLRCVRVLRTVLGTPGTLLILAVPNGRGVVTTVVVAPRTRLIPDNPFNALVGLEDRESGPPPYSIALVELDSTMHLVPGVTRWYRSGSELHGDHALETSSGPMRAHIEIELPSQASLVQRGTLVVLLDLVVIAVLWMLSTVPEGALGRWMRARARRWTRSYRARLTLVLFAFFVVPALVFAFWSYQRLRSDDTQSRSLLVRAELGAVVSPSVPADTTADSLVNDAPSTAPLLVYRDGELRRTGEPLFDALAPTGRLLPPAVDLDLRAGHEVYTSEVEHVGGEPTLFGYIAASTASGNRVVVAAPARGEERMLDQRRRDLGVLVLFATVIGALAALWLSRIASRTLAEPIGRLRLAALAVAGGEREPTLAGRPPEEFSPVFSAFRRMAADLGASRLALESAQRRTSAVLRNVASGVVGLAADGTVTLANPRAAALFGTAIPAGAPIGTISAAVAARLRAFVAGDADDEEFELPVGGRQLQARFTRLRDGGGGGGGGAVLTLDDVTELARAQRVLAWGEMARQVAHEIKNPLTPIRLGVQHLRRAYADARGDFDDILERNAQRILAEIDRLDEIARSFSRYGTAPAERLPAGRTDIAAVARDVVELERMGRGEVEWRVTGADDALFALARPEELREVLLNLLENARLAAARHVEVRCSSHDGCTLVEVRDDGNGIPAAVLPRIFEPHFSTRTSGSGLGLAVSRQLVDGWGGEMAIASTEGEGTTVRIELRTAEPPNG